MDSEALTVVQIALLGVACCYPLLRARRKGAEVDVFELVYPSTAYFFLLFVVRGVYTLSLGSAFISPPVDLATRRALNLAFAYLFPALAAFYAGYYGTYASQLARRLPDLPVRWSASRLASWGWAATAAGAASYLLLIQSLGGFSAYLSSKSETLTAAGTSYLAIGNSLLPAIFTISVSQWASGGTGYVGNLLLVLPPMLFFSATSGSKGAFLTPLLMAIVVHHYLRAKARVRLLFGLAAAALVAMPIFNVYRHVPDIRLLWSYVGDSVSGATAAEFLAHQSMSRFYGVDALALIIRDTPEVMDYQFGSTIYPLLVAWVPRQLWEDKPIVSFGKVFGETYLGEHFAGTGVSASATIVGEGYLNFHVPGMLAAAFLMGLVLRLAYEWLITRNRGGPGVFLYATLFLPLATAWEAPIAGLVSYLLALGAVALALMVLFASRRDATPEVE